MTPKLHLYVLFGVHTKRCKIGATSNPRQRFRAIQAVCSEELVLWSWAECAGHLEWDVHQFFDEYRLHGEWFSPEVTAYIASKVRHRGASSRQLARLCEALAKRRRPSCLRCGTRAEIRWRPVDGREIAECPGCRRVCQAVTARYNRTATP